MKRYRDESGHLTMSIDALHEATKAEADAYFLNGEYYTHDSRIYKCIRWTDTTREPTECIRFESIAGDSNIFCIPENMGSFLPDVASDGLAFARLRIEVKRFRSSVTQGGAEVWLNGKNAASFGDEMYLNMNNGTITNGFHKIPATEFCGEVICGWGSIKPDSDFINGLFYHPHDEVYHLRQAALNAIA